MTSKMSVVSGMAASGWVELPRLYVSQPAASNAQFLTNMHRYEQPPHPSLSPKLGERVEEGWRGEAESYPELGEGVPPDRKLR